MTHASEEMRGGRAAAQSATELAYAHTREGEPPATWELLDEHLHRVSDFAARFSEAFQSREWGAIAGLWHDLGKYSPRFQARLRGSREQVEHAGLGAALAYPRGGSGLALAFAIAGHHAGLANREAQGETRLRSLRERVANNAPDLERIRELVPQEIRDREISELPSFLNVADVGTSAERDALKSRFEMWTRFLFSALVDADFLATEQFYEPERRAGVQQVDTIGNLRQRLDERIARYPRDGVVNSLRARVLESCRGAADLPPGLFSLTVPTGGGKTLSSMAFALKHAERYDMRRVIVAIPYTSIIEQNARTYTEALGQRNVVEHHSNLDEPARHDIDGELEIRRRLAAENWDARVVVTTNVQFLESLFANAPSRCRKLHNVARSVILLDEAQMLPVDYLNCALDVLRQLVDVYGCTLVFMTATQPALRRREALPFGFPEEAVREIVPDPAGLARLMRRVDIRWPEAAEPTSYEALSGALAQHNQVLAVVHLRRDARVLARLLPADHRFHLSALMCAAHRAEVLSRVRGALERGEPCRLVATQLIEAGVDVDFPVVYRALAGLDSLAQAAGRCNREGGLQTSDGNPAHGQFIVFRAATRPPPGVLRKGLESTEALLTRHGTGLEFTDPAVMEEFFRTLYAKCETDRKGIQTERRQLNFASVAQRMHLIEDSYSRPVVVPWGDALDRVRAFEARPSRETQRALQPFLVQIPERDLQSLTTAGALEIIHESVRALTPAFATLYDPTFGLVVDETAAADPDALIV